jgi:hypothetical protein
LTEDRVAAADEFCVMAIGSALAARIESVSRLEAGSMILNAM